MAKDEKEKKDKKDKLLRVEIVGNRSIQEDLFDQLNRAALLKQIGRAHV